MWWSYYLFYFILISLFFHTRLWYWWIVQVKTSLVFFCSKKKKTRQLSFDYLIFGDRNQPKFTTVYFFHGFRYKNAPLDVIQQRQRHESQKNPITICCTVITSSVYWYCIGSTMWSQVCSHYLFFFNFLVNSHIVSYNTVVGNKKRDN